MSPQWFCAVGRQRWEEIDVSQAWVKSDPETSLVLKVKRTLLTRALGSSVGDRKSATMNPATHWAETPLEGSALGFIPGGWCGAEQHQLCDLERKFRG